MTTISKLKKAGSWELAKIVVSVVAQFLYIGIMARLLSKSDFGIMVIAASFIGIGVIFSEGGMGAALIQRRDISKKHINAALHSSIILSLIFLIILSVLAEYLSGFFQSPELEQMLYVIGVIIILNSVSGISMSLLQKNYKFHKAAPVAMASTIIGYSIGIIFAYNDHGVWSLVWAYFTTALISAIGYHYLSPASMMLRFDIKEWKELFSFSSGMILLKIANYFNSSGLMLVLAKLLSLEMLGVFERASRLKDIPNMHLGNLLDSIMFPAMSEAQNNEDRLFTMYRHTIGVSNSLMIPGSCFLIFYASEIVAILLGNQWSEVVIPFQIMLAALPLGISGRMSDAIIRAKGLVYKNVSRKYAFVIVLIASSAYGAYFHGVIGVAIAVAASHLFNYLTMIILIKRILQRSAGEIFLEPIIEGLKLAVVLLCLLLAFDGLMKHYDISSTLSFFTSTFIVFITITLITRLNPRLLGTYLSRFIEQVLNRGKADVQYPAP